MNLSFPKASPESVPPWNVVELPSRNRFVSFTGPLPTTGHYMVISCNLITPTSRKSCYLITPALLNAGVPSGSTTLASTDPLDTLNIDPALLNSGFNIFPIRESIKAVLHFATGPAWKDYVIGPYGAFAEVQIEVYERSNSVTVLHPFGTAFMSPNGSPYGVIIPDFSVKNTVGPRIVDASVVVSQFR